MNLFSQSRLVAVSLALAAFLAGCSKNPVETRQDITCDHVDADGMRIVHRGQVLAQQWQAGVAGSISVDTSAPLDSLAVLFLAPDSTVITGSTISCGDKSLQWEIADTSVVSISAGSQPWTVMLTGRQGGSTTIRFKVFHVDHSDFTSQPIPVTVTGASTHVPVGAINMLLFKGCSRVASWGWHIPGAFGKLIVPLAGQTDPIGAQFQGADTAYVVPDEPGYALAWTLANPAIATVDTVAGQPWHFRIRGLAAGHTMLTLRLVWNGQTELTAGPFDIIVVDPAATPPLRANFLIKKSGVRNVFVRQDTLVAGCGSTASLGFLPVKRDTIEDLFQFRLVNYNNCRETIPSPSFYTLAFEFDDPCLAGIVAHPEHSGEFFEFHLRGLALGETNLRIHYIFQNVLQFTSPPIPVRVTSTGSEPVSLQAGELAW